ncbi:MAG: MFS transporter [Bdellovibrionales bacterium]|nr:MFS transporter [Bdellovibrionales bacterium]
MTKLREPSAVERTRLERWRTSTFWVMLIGYIGYYLCRGNLSAALPLLSQKFGYTNTELGVILTFSEFAYAVGKFTTGPVADQIGGKKVFLVGMVGAIVFNLLFPMFSTILLFTIVWSFCRYFLSMGWGGIIKVIGEWYEPERIGTVMGLISINFQFGSVAASMLCAALIWAGASWQGLFYWPAAIVGAVAIWSYFGAKERPGSVVAGVRFGKNAGTKASMADFDRADGERVKTMKIIRTLFGIPLFRQVLVFSFFAHLLRSVFMFWTPKLLVDIGMGNANAVLTSAIFPLLGCIGTIFIGWYSDNHAKDGDRTLLMCLMLVGLAISLFVISALIPYRLEYQTAILFFLGVGGFCLYGPYSMSAGALSLDIAGPKGAGTCTGMVDGVGYLGGSVAAWGAGYMSDHLGWAQVFVVLGVISIFTVGWTYYMSWFHRRAVANLAAATAA